MKAAVVTDFEHAPELTEFPEPTGIEDKVLVKVLAAGVYPRVRSQADGSHYTSTGKLPFIPGLDGVGELPNGQKVYFLAGDETYGAMAEQTLISPKRLIPLPQDIDASAVAASMNPAMSSWMALRKRLGDVSGKRIMILGATGAAGQLAVKVARYLGASEVIGVGRNANRLATLDADDTIGLMENEATLTSKLKKYADVDVVLDYLWGDVARQVMMTILPARSDHSQEINWVEIGSMSGTEMNLPSAALRSVNLKLIGSGQGSISGKAFGQELPGLADLISKGDFQIQSVTVPFSEFNETNWNDKGQRYVYDMTK